MNQLKKQYLGQNSKEIVTISLWIIGILSFLVRVYINTFNQLYIGNGGYYPLQIRTLIERGELAFSDMPLLFYIEAGIVKLLLLFGASDVDQLIIMTVQFIDSLSIPLLLIPLYFILKFLNRHKNIGLVLIVAGISTLSILTISLTTTSQKNALAITFIFTAIAFFLNYALTKHKSSFIFGIFFFIIIGATHFGAFTFTIVSVIITTIVLYKKKALLPILLTLVFSLSFIYIFDETRFDRLLNSWYHLGFPRPMSIIKIVLYIFLALFALKQFQKNEEKFNRVESTIIKVSIITILVLSFPFIDPQISDRIMGFLFIPLLLLIIVLFPFLSEKITKYLTVIAGVIVLISISFSFFSHPPTELTSESMAELKSLQSYIKSPENSVIVARHNLEFWVAWALNVDVCQETKFNDELIKSYQYIYIINQLNRDHPVSMDKVKENEVEHRRTHFDEPLIPQNTSLIYSSKHFKLYEYNKD